MPANKLLVYFIIIAAALLALLELAACGPVPSSCEPTPPGFDPAQCLCIDASHCAAKNNGECVPVLVCSASAVVCSGACCEKNTDGQWVNNCD